MGPRGPGEGNTLRRPACVHWAGWDVEGWLDAQQDTTILGVEVAVGSVRIGDLAAAHQCTVVVLGHERDGIPRTVLDRLYVAVQIPMVGSGTSLNVAVAGSLALYRLAGLM